MLSRPSSEALRALVQLRVIPAWADVLKMLEEELDRTLELLVERQDEPGMRQLQGRARLLQEIRQLAEDAPRLLAAPGGR